MTRNVAQDASPLSAVFLNSILNALEGEAVRDGCSASKGTGDFDVDIAAGTVSFPSDPQVSVSAATETLTTPSSDADLDSGETRVDVISINTSGSTNVTEGTAHAGTSADPVVAPDIPSDEVAIAVVTVDGGAAALTSGDIFDYRGIIAVTRHSLYGDGDDGSITDSSSQNRSGLVEATDYTLQSGNTVTVNNENLAIVAEDSITINGTIDASGAGGNGGTSAGQNGSAGAFAPLGSGGSGGSGGGDASNGGDGGGGDTSSGITRREQFTLGLSPLTLLETPGGAGGGAGADGVIVDNEAAGSDGATPGGGGGGGESGSGSAGAHGDGGDGGGVVVLAAPNITVGGTIQAAGTDGADGGTTDAGGGGGGGGSGGVIAILTPDLTENSPTYDVSAGSGGTGGSDNSGDNIDSSGGDGANGAAGSTIKVTLS